MALNNKLAKTNLEDLPKFLGMRKWVDITGISRTYDNVPLNKIKSSRIRKRGKINRKKCLREKWLPFLNDVINEPIGSHKDGLRNNTRRR